MNRQVRGTWYVVLGVVLLALRPTGPLAAQADALAARLAPLLAAEDARDLQVDLFDRALLDPEVIIRRTAIRGIGRIGDPRGVALLLGVLSRPDTAGLHAEAAFGLGLIKDTSAVEPIITWLRTPTLHAPAAVVEGITALAKLGGPRSGEFFAQVLEDPSLIQVDAVQPVQAVREAPTREAWRLGRAAPVGRLIDALQVPGLAVSASYSLGRLRAAEAGQALLTAVRSTVPAVRENAARALTGPYTATARLERSAVIAALRPLLNDDSPALRITAIRSLASFRDSTLTRDVAPLLNDRMANVQVTAATALAQLGGSGAVAPLREAVTGHHDWAVRREALIALGRVDQAAFRAELPAWANSNDWRDRATAAEVLARIAPQELGPFVADADPRVIAATLAAWAGPTGVPAPQLVDHARNLLSRPDPMVRAAAAEILSRVPAGRDAAPLATAFRRAATDSINDAAQAALSALAAIAKSADSLETAGFVATEPAPRDPLLKEWAEANWPALAEHWGPSRPIMTGRSLEDYRTIARTYLVGSEEQRSPRVTIETAERGTIPLILFGADAPLTVANFLRLVDRHYFDGIRWHRVVANFVIQAGDPRGDGSGGPGWAIRDEINRQRYGAYYLGMALSGPDTGGSQWFITLSPQPHLDGTYTIFGQLTGGDAVAWKITQGDQIRRIRR